MSNVTPLIALIVSYRQLYFIGKIFWADISAPSYPALLGLSIVLLLLKLSKVREKLL